MVAVRFCFAAVLMRWCKNGECMNDTMKKEKKTKYLFPVRSFQFLTFSDFFWRGLCRQKNDEIRVAEFSVFCLFRYPLSNFFGPFSILLSDIYISNIQILTQYIDLISEYADLRIDFVDLVVFL